MKNIVGNLVTGDNFFGREKEIKALWSALETDNILFLAPRRVGKTSLMKTGLLPNAIDYKMDAIYISISSAMDEVSFIKELYKEVLKCDESIVGKIQANPVFKRLMETGKLSFNGVSIEFNDKNQKNWQELLGELLGILSKKKTKTLILIDEVPIFVLNLVKIDASGARAKKFLYGLRELRQNIPDCRWLLAGSIGLDTVTARLNMSDSINDLRIETLGAFDFETADAFLRELCSAYDIEMFDDVRNYSITQIGWAIPYYIQLMFGELRSIDKKIITKTDIDSAFKSLLTPANKTYFDYWRQRLVDELGRPEADYALSLLNNICSTRSGVSKDTLKQELLKSINNPVERDEKLRDILDTLENDGYLVKGGNRYRFRMELLRRYWKERIA